MKYYIFGDNLGNHKATKNLDLNKKDIKNVYGISNRSVLNNERYISRLFLGEEYIDLKHYKENEPADVSLLLSYLTGFQLRSKNSLIRGGKDFLKMLVEYIWGYRFSEINLGSEIILKCYNEGNPIYSYIRLNDSTLELVGAYNFYLKTNGEFSFNDNKIQFGQGYVNFFELDSFQILFRNNGGNVLIDRNRALFHKDVEISSTNNGIYLSANNNFFPNAKITLDTQKLYIPQGAQINYVLTCVSTDGKAEWKPVSGSSGNEVYTFHFQARGASSGYISHFYIFDYNGNNENLRSTTTPYDVPSNNTIIPYTAPKNIKLIRCSGTIYHACISTGTPNYPVKVPIQVYRNNYSDRTLLGTFDILLYSVGIYNDLSQNNFTQFDIDLSTLNITLQAGENFGIQFTGNNGNNIASGIKGCYLNLIAIPI